MGWWGGGGRGEVSNLVFYAQSTIAVISGLYQRKNKETAATKTEKERERERQTQRNGGGGGGGGIQNKHQGFSLKGRNKKEDKKKKKY